MTTKPIRRPGQLRIDMSRAMDAALARRPEHTAKARQARLWGHFQTAWKGLGYPDDQARKRRMFAQVLPQLEAGVIQDDARRSLAASLTAHDRRQRAEAVRREAAAQGRLRGISEYFAASATEGRALTAALEARIAHQRPVLGRRSSLIRFPLP